MENNWEFEKKFGNLGKTRYLEKIWKYGKIWKFEKKMKFKNNWKFGKKNWNFGKH